MIYKFANNLIISSRSYNDRADCDDVLFGLAHHGNASYCAVPAAALVFHTLHANQASSISSVLRKSRLSSGVRKGLLFFLKEVNSACWSN